MKSALHLSAKRLILQPPPPSFTRAEGIAYRNGTPGTAVGYFKRTKLWLRCAGSGGDGQPCLRSMGLLPWKGWAVSSSAGSHLFLHARGFLWKKFLKKQPKHVRTFCSCIQWWQDFRPRIRELLEGAIGSTPRYQLCRADHNHGGLTTLGECGLRRLNIAQELEYYSGALIWRKLFAEDAFELRGDQAQSPLLWVILTWEGSSTEHRSARREPQNLVNLVVVNTEAGLEEIQKSASAGEQSQANASAREKIMQ